MEEIAAQGQVEESMTAGHAVTYFLSKSNTILLDLASVILLAQI